MGAKASKAAGQQLEAAQARFPAEEVSGAVERAGMGETKKSFDTIKSFAWTLGGTGEWHWQTSFFCSMPAAFSDSHLRMEQIRLCAVWPRENWLGSSMNNIQGWMTV